MFYSQRVVRKLLEQEVQGPSCNIVIVEGYPYIVPIPWESLRETHMASHGRSSGPPFTYSIDKNIIIYFN